MHRARAEAFDLTVRRAGPRTGSLRRAAAGLLAGLALAFTASAAELELGTLFHTPEERARLDRMRRGEPLVTATPERPSAPPEMTGFVKRSDGHHTLWINGVPVATSNPNALPLLDPRKVRDDAVRFPESAVRTSP